MMNKVVYGWHFKTLISFLHISELCIRYILNNTPTQLT